MSSAHPHDLAIPKPTFSTNGLPEILRGKHKFRILWDLQYGSRRFGEIRKGLGSGVTDAKEVAPRVLSRELKFLLELGLIHRTAYAEIPPRVEYRLTSLGRSLLPVMSKILEWGKRHPWHRQMPAALVGPVRRTSGELIARHRAEAEQL